MAQIPKEAPTPRPSRARNHGKPSHATSESMTISRYNARTLDRGAGSLSKQIQQELRLRIRATDPERSARRGAVVSRKTSFQKTAGGPKTRRRPAMEQFRDPASHSQEPGGVGRSGRGGRARASSRTRRRTSSSAGRIGGLRRRARPGMLPQLPEDLGPEQGGIAAHGVTKFARSSDLGTRAPKHQVFAVTQPAPAAGKPVSFRLLGISFASAKVQ